MTRFCVVLICCAVATVAAAQKPKPAAKAAPTPPGVVSMNAADWNIRYSSGMPAHPSPAVGGGWFLDFPIAPGHVNTITVPYTAPIALGKWLILTATVTTADGAVVIPDNDMLGFPTHMRPYIEQKAKQLPGVRFWSNPIAVPLTAGTYQLAVPFTPDQWSGWDGKFANYDASTLKSFNDVLAHIGYVGLTCGGSFFAHGCHVETGSARFTLSSYSIQ